MARTENRLTAKSVAAHRRLAKVTDKITGRTYEEGKPRFVSDGNNLYLNVISPSSASWIYRYKSKGSSQSTDVGLGSARLVSLAQARIKRDALHAQRGADLDPLAEVRKAKRSAAPAKRYTWRELWTATLEARRKQIKSRHAVGWEQSLEKHCAPINDRYADELTKHDFLAIVEPLWFTQHKVARDVLNRCDIVWRHAREHHRVEGDSPARRELFPETLPPTKIVQPIKRHHPAMPEKQVPDFMARLAKIDSSSARALELAILTGVRSGEARGARFSEFDLDAGEWVIPAERMKMKDPHRVPVSRQVEALVRRMAELRDVRAQVVGMDHLNDDLLFPSIDTGGVIAPQTLIRTMKAAGGGEYRPHGFRSTLRDWAEETARARHSVAEAMLAHKAGDPYKRGDNFDERRELMQKWADLVLPEGEDNVVVELARKAG